MRTSNISKVMVGILVSTSINIYAANVGSLALDRANIQDIKDFSTFSKSDQDEIRASIEEGDHAMATSVLVHSARANAVAKAKALEVVPVEASKDVVPMQPTTASTSASLPPIWFSEKGNQQTELGIVSFDPQNCVAIEVADISLKVSDYYSSKKNDFNFEVLRSTGEYKGDGSNIKSALANGSLVALMNTMNSEYQNVKVAAVAESKIAKKKGIIYSQAGDEGFLFKGSILDIRHFKITVNENKFTKNAKKFALDLSGKSMTLSVNDRNQVNVLDCQVAGKKTQYVVFDIFANGESKASGKIAVSPSNAEILTGATVTEANALVSIVEEADPVKKVEGEAEKLKEAAKVQTKVEDKNTEKTDTKKSETKKFVEKMICMEDGGAQLRDEELNAIENAVVTAGTMVLENTSAKSLRKTISGEEHVFVEISTKIDSKDVVGRVSAKFLSTKKLCKVSEGSGADAGSSGAPANASIEARVQFFSKKGVPAGPLRKALVFLQNNRGRFGLRTDLMVVNDFTRKNSAIRSWVIDLKNNQVNETVIAHGDGNQRNPKNGIARFFSNNGGSNATPPGFHKTDSSFQSYEGGNIVKRIWSKAKAKAKWKTPGLLLIGLEKGKNDKSAARGIVIHGAPKYMSLGDVGRSNGCGSWIKEFALKHMPRLVGGTLWYNHTPGG